MRILEALAILEAATLECKKREVDTPELRDALDFLEPHATLAAVQYGRPASVSNSPLPVIKSNMAFDACKRSGRY